MATERAGPDGVIAYLVNRSGAGDSGYTRHAFKGNELETATHIEKLDWFPLYIDDLISDPIWNVEDFQFCWFIKLVIHCARSKRRGYIPKDQFLWKLAGARTGQWFEKNRGPVLAAFEVARMDDQDWLFNRKLLKVLSEQSTKYRRNPQKLDVPALSLSVVDFDEVLKVVQRLFQFYVQVFARDARYKLTDQREKKCVLRLQELMRDNGGDLAKAESSAREAIENLSTSDWHIQNGHFDWLEQIFRSQEEFQKRLCMKRQEIKKTSASVGYQGEVPAFDWAVLTEEERYAWADVHWRRAGKDESRIPEYMRPYLKLKA